MIDQTFITAFNATASSVHATALAKGWWDQNRNDGECIALTHSELSEMLEYLRTGDGPSDHIPNFKGAEEEAADVIVRLMDLGVARGWRIAEALVAKMEYNKTRPNKHGKLF